MPSPEFQPTLEQAQAYRAGEAAALWRARTGGLQDEAKDYLAVLKKEQPYQQARRLTVFNRWETMGARMPEFSPPTWEKAGRVFSAFNNGVKAGLFLAIAKTTAPKTYMPVEDIVNRFKELFAGSELLQALDENHHNTKNSVVNYCQQSLCGVGLLTAEYDVEEQLVGFGITKEGQDFGVPAALLTLRFENKTQQSLYPTLGITGSAGETRSPLNRVRVLDYLARQPSNVREADLVTVLDSDSHITYMLLNKFNQQGVVEYKAITNATGKTPLKYQIKPGVKLTELPYVSGIHALQDQIIAVINSFINSQKMNFSIKEVVDQLPPEVNRRWKKKKQLQKAVSETLSGFAREGGLTRVDQMKGREKQSDISLTRQGRDVVVNLLWPVLSIISGTAPTQAQTAIIKDSRRVWNQLPAFAQISAELYYPHSISSKQRKHRENLQKAIDILSASPQPLTKGELAEQLKLSPNTIGNYFRPHIPGSKTAVVEVNGRAHEVEITKINGVNHYSLAISHL